MEITTEPETVARYVEDAAHYPGGHAIGVARPHDASEVASVISTSERVLVVGAQSSLTGGATPHGGVVLSTERLRACEIHGDRVTAGAGLPLGDLQQQLATHGRWFPPVPTFLGATVGGAVSTNAAGAATFKYGPVRPWVDALTVVLANGEVLAIARGSQFASADGMLQIGGAHIRAPQLRMPAVPKCSAGYFSAPGMDLIDLFIGAEGTLGVIVDATLRTGPRPEATCSVLVPLRDEAEAIDLASDLRDEARRTWMLQDGNGIDVAAIEHMDARSLQVVREDGVDRKLNISIPADAHVLLLVQLELAERRTDDDLWSEVANVRSKAAATGALTRFCQLLDRHGVLDDAEIAFPGQQARSAAFVELREAVPAGVNRRVAHARATVDARIHKTAADMIVPFDRFAEMMRRCRTLFAERQLDLAVWGHISDGNVHPNVIPRSFEDIERGGEAIVELGRLVVEMGGSPLAEHGVGRNPVKQRLLRLLYRDEGVADMRTVKQSLDPEGKLAPGVLFSESPENGRVTRA